jgi:hypothetical protein
MLEPTIHSQYLLSITAANEPHKLLAENSKHSEIPHTFMIDGKFQQMTTTQMLLAQIPNKIIHSCNALP